MNRRKFLTVSGALAAASTLPVPAVAARAPQKLIRPPRLKPRALVGLVAPSGATDDAHVQRCVTNLESLGFSVKVAPHILAAHGGYAGSPAERAADLHAMFVDREVGAIWAARGGSGAPMVLPLLDYGLIRRHPKILIGYSDITALHLALHARAGLISFHGPVASSSFNDYSATHMLSVLMEPQPEYQINMSIENERRAAAEPQFALRTIRPGVAKGRLIGGNLSLVSALVGTPYAADFRKGLLFLEEVDEEPYRVDRMLTQLQQNLRFEDAAGVMLGVFQKGTAKGGQRQLTMNEVLDDHFAALKVPSVCGFSFGHIAQQITIPEGVMAKLDTEERTLTLLEPAVS